MPYFMICIWAGTLGETSRLAFRIYWVFGIRISSFWITSKNMDLSLFSKILQHSVLMPYFFSNCKFLHIIAIHHCCNDMLKKYVKKIGLWLTLSSRKKCNLLSITIAILRSLLFGAKKHTYSVIKIWLQITKLRNM